MSIIIEDMIMPKSCVACPFEHNGDCYGGKPKLIMDIEDFKYYRHPNCPLKEIVRCKDCKHYERLMNLCRKFDEYGLAESDFCSQAERKDEVEE